MVNNKPTRNLIVIVILIFSIFILMSGTVFSQNVVNVNPPNQQPTVSITMDKLSEDIDTSADVAEPMVDVTGKVTLESTVPMVVSVNLTLHSLWNATVDPQHFNLTIPTTGSTDKVITVTVKAPLGIGNNTDQKITIAGTYSYINELTSVLLENNISPVYVTIVAQNSTIETPNGGDGDGKSTDKNDEPSFLPGFESIFLIGSIIMIIILIQTRKRK